MRIDRVWITGRPNGQGYLASVTIDCSDADGHHWQLRGIRMIDTADGLKIAMPNILDAQGRWRTIFAPQDTATSDLIRRAILAEWERPRPRPMIVVIR